MIDIAWGQLPSATFISSRLEDAVPAVADMIHWLDEAGLRTEVVFATGDLAILTARPLQHATTPEVRS